MRAKNELHLCSIIDEVGDPGCARWAVYNGPIWVDIDLPMLPWKGDDYEQEVDIEKVNDFIESEGEAPWEAAISGTDTGWRMKQAIGKWALPRLQAVMDAWHEAQYDEGDDHDPTPWRGRVAAALDEERADMDHLLAARRLHVARTLDPATKQLMAVTGVSIEPTWAYAPGAKKRDVGKAMELLRGRPKKPTS